MIPTSFDSSTVLGIDELHEVLIKSAAESLNLAAQNIKLPGIFLTEIDISRKNLTLVDGLYLGAVETSIAVNEIEIRRKELLIRAARKRHDNDPKQEAKQFVKECWKQWKIKPVRYSSQTAFANDVLTKVAINKNGDPIISFDTIVKKWIPDWTKEKK